MNPISAIRLHNAEPVGGTRWVGMTGTQRHQPMKNAIRGVDGTGIRPLLASVPRQQIRPTTSMWVDASASCESLACNRERQKRRLPLHIYDSPQVSTPSFLADDVRTVELHEAVFPLIWDIGIPPRLRSPAMSKLAELLARQDRIRRLSQQAMQTASPTETVKHPTLRQPSTVKDRSKSTDAVFSASILFPFGNPFWSLLNRSRPRNMPPIQHD